VRFPLRRSESVVVHGLVAPISRRGAARLRKLLACQFDAIGVVDDAIQDCVGQRGDADQIVPAVHGTWTGDDQRAPVVAVLDDFQEIARLVGGERFGSPIVEA